MFLFFYTLHKAIVFELVGCEKLSTTDMGGEERSAWNCLPLGEKRLNTVLNILLTDIIGLYHIVHLHIARKNLPLYSMTTRPRIVLQWLYSICLRPNIADILHIFGLGILLQWLFFHSGRCKYYIFMNYNLHAIYYWVSRLEITFKTQQSYYR